VFGTVVCGGPILPFCQSSLFEFQLNGIVDTFERLNSTLSIRGATVLGSNETPQELSKTDDP
jgi:hypothetical protein